MQGGEPQAHSLLYLGKTSNRILVETSQCTTKSTPTDLFCPFTNSDELIVNPDTGVALQEVMFQICLCNSAMTFKYTLTNGIEAAYPCNQCPIQVLIDYLSLANDFTVFKDDFNITSIAVLVSVLSYQYISRAKFLVWEGVGKEGGESGAGKESCRKLIFHVTSAHTNFSHHHVKCGDKNDDTST